MNKQAMKIGEIPRFTTLEELKKIYKSMIQDNEIKMTDQENIIYRNLLVPKGYEKHTEPLWGKENKDNELGVSWCNTFCASWSGCFYKNILIGKL